MERAREREREGAGEKNRSPALVALGIVFREKITVYMLKTD